MQLVMTPELLIEAYRQGLFPMAYSGESAYVHWICPEERGQLPIEDLHVSKSLKKTVLNNIKRNGPYKILIDTAFERVMRECAAAQEDRPETWINEPIIEVYCALHKRGMAHSVEVWEDEKLVGGVYGVSLGGAFFGESMFSRKSNTSKIALVHLCARLWKAGYLIFDTQFVNDHLLQFGAYEVSHCDYIENLNAAVKKQTDFTLSDTPGLDEATLVNEYFEMRKKHLPGEN
ncbi:MAG TPA: leucyl/phenylalanyl-tRNA--protein transferase [Alphaproteobacteria bacterium]|nr:leucyl/phenylalanyl-tRNA--protein transferase [Alphaproteobacteria bacterium]USO05094.1 MAG: leucyl/phenylalanyl-tRNA--protein transferase [Rhodospirillales bacterium]HOO82892.1 leucyl/phenylalanyl-tRNA--protein transferase [Alphaproteobacteria bacterium]